MFLNYSLYLGEVVFNRFKNGRKYKTANIQENGLDQAHIANVRQRGLKQTNRKTYHIFNELLIISPIMFQSFERY